jgi:hypothetical protein
LPRRYQIGAWGVETSEEIGRRRLELENGELHARRSSAVLSLDKADTVIDEAAPLVPFRDIRQSLTNNHIGL